MLKARNYIPALKFGGKILPQDIAGMVGLPYVGNVFYVDATNGLDTNTGDSWDSAYKTLTKAEDSCVTNHYDVIIVAPNGNTGTAEVAGITWDKNYITVIGANAENGIAQRSRIIWTVDSTDPCLTISGIGNRFINVQLATFQASNDVLVSITGDRNYFNNVHFVGIGHETAGDDTTARCISLSGADENLFENCTIGVDTVNRSAANASVELASASTRNVFRGCLFPLFADNAGALFVKIADAAAIDRFVMFDHCMFHNAANSSASTMTVAMDLHAAAGGSVILWDCWLFGATDWADDFTIVEAAGSMVQATGNTAGLMVAAA